MEPKLQAGQRVAIKSEGGSLAWVLETSTDWRFARGRWVQHKKNPRFIAVAVDRGGEYLSPGIALVSDVMGPWDEYERDRAARLERERVKREREFDLERRFEALALGEGAVLVGGMVRLPLDRLETLLKNH